MKRTLAAVGALTVLMVSACSGGDPDPEPSETSPSSASATIKVELTTDVVVDDDGSVTVTAQSNLPDGTELDGSVSADDVFTAQDRAVLQDGTATFGPFSAKGEALPAGAYAVRVTMPIARNQPEQVTSIIGEHGENLTGPQVSTEDGTGDAVVATSEPLIIP
ncbi:hypothetical protein [Oerskovia gallyi]|uniref:DUF4382 domain-containing protein n=1 Tax=Oerskovia gallyi TaxID=2762226 RepID=A0ABR8V2Z0_9CELL|nr:hypothetical protein [Oerskovia gallyi]MBD7998656.1 hypothetical protein [Oerskovia gallyi]